MTASRDPRVVERDFLDSLGGGEPPADTLERIGGWAAIGALAPLLADNPLLTPAVALVACDITPDDTRTDVVRAAVTGLIEALVTSTDPLQFAQGLDEFCTNEVLLAGWGDNLATRCLPLAQPPPPEDGQLHPPAARVSRHADALETYTRLAITGHASEYKLFALLEDIPEPQPRRYAQAVLRSIGAACDHWEVGDRVTDVIDTLTGVEPPRYPATPTAEVTARNREYGLDIASDASWTKANIEVLHALRACKAQDASQHLASALEALDFIQTEDDRDDVAVLDVALRLLWDFLDDWVEHGSGVRSAAEWDLDSARIRVLTERARNFTITAHGLNHWSGDRKQVVLAGWARLARDLEWLRDQVDRDSLYNAGVVLDDLLQIYSASHTYELTQRIGGIDAVRDVLRPSISGGFAARAGLMRNLDDHIEYLQSSSERGDDSVASDIEERLQAATVLRDAARSGLRSSAEPPGKDERQAAVLPPPLAEFAADYDGLAVALSGVPQASLDRLAIELADRHSARALEPDLVITSVRKKIVAALEHSPDFEGEVAAAITEVLDQLIRFVARRMNTQESSKAYLFKYDADESDLHKDLYDWLCQGQFASNTNAEVQEVGAGRTDIQIVFPGFNLYLELKVDDTMVPVAGKSAYIKQTVTYQATDVRIGFLVVLRLSPPRDKGPAPHLRDYVSHTTATVPGDSEARHVVMLEIPGRQTKPSRMR